MGKSPEERFSLSDKYCLVALWLTSPWRQFSKQLFSRRIYKLNFQKLLCADAGWRARGFFNDTYFLSFEKAWKNYPGAKEFPPNKSFADLYNCLRWLSHPYTKDQALILLQFIADRYTAKYGLPPLTVVEDTEAEEQKRGGFWRTSARTLGVGSKYLRRNGRFAMQVLGHELEHAAHTQAAGDYAARRSKLLVDGLYYLNHFFNFPLEENKKRYHTMFIEVAGYASQAVACAFALRPLPTPAFSRAIARFRKRLLDGKAKKPPRNPDVADFFAFMADGIMADIQALKNLRPESHEEPNTSEAMRLG